MVAAQQFFSMATRIGLWLLVCAALAGWSFLLMTAMAGAIRDGWQARDLGQLVGALVSLLLTFLVVRQVGRAWRSASGELTPKRPWLLGVGAIAVAVAAGALLVAVLGYLGRREESGAMRSSDDEKSPRAEAQVMVSVARSPCDGCRQEYFDQESAVSLKDELADLFLSSMNNGLRGAGQDPAELDLHVESDVEVTEFKGRRVVFVHLAIPGVSRATVATGLVGDETVQVKCIATGAAIAPLESKECRSQLEAAFPAEG